MGGIGSLSPTSLASRVMQLQNENRLLKKQLQLASGADAGSPSVCFVWISALRSRFSLNCFILHCNISMRDGLVRPSLAEALVLLLHAFYFACFFPHGSLSISP